MPVTRRARAISSKVLDEMRFLKSWVERPLTTGAVRPSSAGLSRLMASLVELERPGPVIELGPGTGVVTKALLERGVAPERLFSVEFNPEFCKLLERRYPDVRFIQGDAYDLKGTLSGVIDQPPAAVVSSLPLLTRPPQQRVDLLGQALDLLEPGAPFIQFSYGVSPPISAKSGDFVIERTSWVVLNLPPARVWAYRRPFRPVHDAA